MAHIRYRLAEILEEYQLTAKEVAEATGIRPSTLSAIRRGQIRRLPEEVLVALCQYFRQRDPEFGVGQLLEFEEELPEALATTLKRHAVR